MNIDLAHSNLYIQSISFRQELLITKKLLLENGSYISKQLHIFKTKYDDTALRKYETATSVSFHVFMDLCTCCRSRVVFSCM